VKSIARSLADLLPEEYLASVVGTCEFLGRLTRAEAQALAHEKVEFYPEAYEVKLRSLLSLVGQPVVGALQPTIEGAPTDSYRAASKLAAAPIGSSGWFRVGEDGRLYLTTKSEHYHTPLGHTFPGYRLIENARKLGIPNATHNNTRGFITRFLEQEIIRAVNGLACQDSEQLSQVLASRAPHVLNRIINLETGSLACEAAIKMMLARFYPPDSEQVEAKYRGKIPVFLVVADNAGGITANYHGTTIFAQCLRGMWPTFYEAAERAGLLKIVAVAINDAADFAGKIEQYNQGPYKTAGFLHEIILMNYGGICLQRDYLQHAYELCHNHDTPVLCDEIQSCLWYPDLFLFRTYGLNPDFLTIGKGFSGGTYPASRLVTTCEMDNLSQFGALVTNGQEELASLAYLITMEMARANADAVQNAGSYYEQAMRALAGRYPDLVGTIEGRHFLLTIGFRNVALAVDFCKIMVSWGFDISAQTYKPNCPPVAITKLPITADEVYIDYLVKRMEDALNELKLAG
jgi:acetylornithine/succinyldiaminopimelate/putrescine aminotransferase